MAKMCPIRHFKLRPAVAGLMAILLTLMLGCGDPGSHERLSAQRSPIPTASIDNTRERITAVPGPPPPSDFIRVEFGVPSDAGTKITISIVGDSDGETVLSNQRCCGISDIHSFIRDVRVRVNSVSLRVEKRKIGWVVEHEPSVPLEITYKLNSAKRITIDSGMADQVTPIVNDKFLHLMGGTALLLPSGRPKNGLVALYLSMKRDGGDGDLVSSFGPPGAPVPSIVQWGQIERSVYVGGAYFLETLRPRSGGAVGVVHTGMERGFQSREMQDDVMAIVEAAREFFGNGQPWYFVSVHGGDHVSPEVNVGGGMGLTNSFVMFVRSDLDLMLPEHREHFRWVFAHEYFHEWNGLTLRVAPVEGTNRDDTSAYWFSEGFTEFYAMRLLTRSGMQSPARSVDVMNHKFARYMSNSKRALSAKRVGALFWSSREAEQIAYLRGYLAAWYIERELERASANRQSLDMLLKTLVSRARKEPELRVDTAFLIDYFGSALSSDAARKLRSFVVDGGTLPFDVDSFAPCLAGYRTTVFGADVLQFEFAEPKSQACFSH